MATETMETLRTTGRAPANGTKGSHSSVPGTHMTDQVIERIVERIGGRAGVETAFGEPISRGDLTVVPVARVRWAFGAGTGPPMVEEGKAASGNGAGAGGAVVVDPIGYLHIGTAGTEFKPIVPPYPSPLFLLASGITAAIVLRSLARLLRR